MSVVIGIPVYKETVDVYERISLTQCGRIFSRYPIRLIAPAKLNIGNYLEIFENCTDIDTLYFNKKYFTSLQSYNRFMKSIRLFSRLEEFGYLLTYHTDAFVFRNELEYWMDKEYDYIGAPLYQYDGTIHPEIYVGVGNRGFSLQKISSAMKVLTTWKKVYPAKELIAWYDNFNFRGKLYYSAYFIKMLAGLGGWSHHLLNANRINEDVFWGIHVPAAFPDYKVAPFGDAFRFSMEYNCIKLWELNRHKLPFGCHQWFKKEFLSFWKEKVEDFGYEIP